MRGENMRRMTGIVWLLLCLLGLYSEAAAVGPDVYPVSPGWVTALPSAETAEQMVIVVGEDVPNASVSLHEKDADGIWREILTTSTVNKN